MLEKTIGFIGGGNMGSAMIGGILSSGLSDKRHVMASAKSDASTASLHTRFDISTTTKNKEVAAFSDILFLAVKP